MPNNPGSSSYDNSSSGQWGRLDELMQQVYNINVTLDDARRHATFNDGTMRSFIYPLEHVKNALTGCAPPGQAAIIAEHLRLACDHLNLAADEFEYKKRRTPAFYKYKNQALKRLREVLTIWENIQNGR